MVNTFTAGDPLRAPLLRDRAASIVMLAEDIYTLQVQPNWIAAPGLAVPVRSSARYLIDGWLGLSVGDVGDFAWRLVGPPDCFVAWNSLAPQTDQTDGIGEVNFIRQVVDANPSFPNTISTMGGGTACGVHVGGRLLCQNFAGSLQVQFAKNNESVGSNARVMRGSWLRVYRVDDALFEGVE